MPSIIFFVMFDSEARLKTLKHLQQSPICTAQEDFWSNVGRYGSYFFSVLLGTAYTAVKPIGGWLKKPVSAVLTITAIIGLYIFVSSTVTAMLGVNSEDVLVLPPSLYN